MTECNIVINEYELYEKYPLELVARHVFDELKELFEPLDYKFTVDISKVSERTQILFDMWKPRDESVKISGFDIYKHPNSCTFMWICSCKIPLFICDSSQTVPLIEQLKNYFKTVENMLNETMKHISVHVNVVPLTKNAIDFYRVNLRYDDGSDDEHEGASSMVLSLKMSNYRRQLNEQLQNSHGEMRATSESIVLHVSPATYKRMCKCVNVNELYCLQIKHPTDTKYNDYDIPYWFEWEVELAKDVEECAKNVKKCTVNGVAYDCMFIDDHDDIFSYFIGNTRQKEAIPCICKRDSPMYVLYNISNEVQTFKIENDNASTYIIELMFADNGSDVFECYYRTDKVCCGPDPACDRLSVTRYKVNVVVDKMLCDDEEVSEEESEEESEHEEEESE